MVSQDDITPIEVVQALCLLVMCVVISIIALPVMMVFGAVIGAIQLPMDTLRHYWSAPRPALFDRIIGEKR